MTRLNTVMPFFIVRNLKASQSFYQEKLGFKCTYSAPPNEPFFAIVTRDDVSMMLKEIGPGIEGQPNGTIHAWARFDAFVNVSDPDLLFAEFEARGVTFTRPLADHDDGLRGFEVQDVDGFILYFGRPVD